jgi:hypothetical protein|tara:strand:+ start:701 stop:979 length:279 start_codon:yes stop_codon:yes gene_type:complete
MEIYQIEKLPMPDDTRGRKKSKIRTTLEALDVGDTFFIPNKDLDVETSRQQVYRCANAINTKLEEIDKFYVKTFVEQEGLRVFRVKTSGEAQ